VSSIVSEVDKSGNIYPSFSTQRQTISYGNEYYVEAIYIICNFLLY
jgi:hypothetical protein